MLTSLRLHNVATISDAQLELGAGLNVLTGETGAGKSILVDGLLLALGERADTGIVRSGEKIASVEASFLVDEKRSVLVRREVHSAGRSRLLVDDEARTLEEFRPVIAPLIELHTQRSTSSLLRRPVQRRYLDEFSGVLDLAGEVEELHSETAELLAAITDIERMLSERESDRGFIAHEIEEIDRLDPSREEFEGLREERVSLLSLEEQARAYGALLEALSGEDPGSSGMSVLQGLAAAESQLATVRGESAGSLRELLEQAQVSVNEMVGLCQSLLDGCQSAPWRLAELDERLDTYSRLLERYHGSIDELVDRREALEGRLVELAGMEGELESKRTTLTATLEKLSLAARRLSESRSEGAILLQDSVTGELKKLGMPEATFSVDLTPPSSSSSLIAATDGSRIASFGLEQVEFLFSANPGSPAGPLSSIASGGELSRASLAMKLALARVAQPRTMVFDEIDSGVAGETAHLLAEALERAASDGRQVIVITHLAQIACRANRHISVSKKIEKDRPVTMVRTLENEERVTELARVLGGGEAAIAHARSLLNRKSH